MPIVTTTLADGTVQTVNTDAQGNVIWTSLAPPVGSADAIAIANVASLRSKAQTALTNNATYQAIPTPTTAQTIAQVAALTRQVNALIRLAIDQPDSTTGT